MLWAAACAGDQGGEAGRAGGQGRAVQLSLRAEPAVVAPRGVVTVVLGLRNPADTTLTLHFPTAQRYDFTVRDTAGAVVWRWSADRAFAQVVGEQPVPAGWEVNYEERFAAPAMPGPYRVVGTVTARGDPGSAAANFTVR